MYFITTKSSAHADGSKFRVLHTAEKRDAARAKAAEHNGTVRTQAELDELIAADKVDARTLPGYVAPEPVKALVELAKDIKAANRARRTIGTKEKVAKRVATPQDVLDAATAYAKERIAVGSVKVALVRELAGWRTDGGARLQRRDMFAVLHGLNADVADATIATQFQVVRAAELAAK